MTPIPTPSSSAPFPELPPGGSGPPVRVDTPGLLASVPVLLGFRPRDSLVVLSTGGPEGRRVGLSLRTDLPPPEAGELLDALCRNVAAAIARDRPSGAAVVVVGGGVPVPASSGDEPPRSEVAGAAVLALLDTGIGVHTAAWVAAIEEGAPWRCYGLHDCGCEGSLPDPGGTVLAAEAAYRGTVVYPSREELRKVVAPADPAGSGGAGVDSGLRTAPRWPADPVHALRAAIDAAAAGRLTVDAQLVRIMTSALRRSAFRDLALSTCVGPQAAAAEQLWAALSRLCRGSAAAEPAVLLAVCALARGDGALASMALDRAETVRPAYRLAKDVRAAMRVGWGPTEVRAWLEGER
jgi:hypothetical protein